MPICGPKLSLCGLILSIWGIVQLGLMGYFYYINSVALAEDLPKLEENSHSPEMFYKHVDDSYRQIAYNCWATAIAYVVLLLISAQQFWANSRASATA